MSIFFCFFFKKNNGLSSRIQVTEMKVRFLKNVNNINISDEPKELKGYHWGALHVNGVAP